MGLAYSINKRRRKVKSRDFSYQHNAQVGLGSTCSTKHAAHSAKRSAAGAIAIVPELFHPLFQYVARSPSSRCVVYFIGYPPYSIFFYTLPLGIDIFDVLIPIQPSKYDFKIISVAFFCTIRRVFYLNIFHILILFYEIYNFFFKFSTRSSTVYPSGTVSCLFSWEWFLKFLKAAVIDSPPVRKFFTINLRCLPVRSTSKYRKFK